MERIKEAFVTEDRMRKPAPHALTQKLENYRHLQSEADCQAGFRLSRMPAAAPAVEWLLSNAIQKPSQMLDYQ